MKTQPMDYTEAEVRLGEQGRISDTEGYWWVCLEGCEDEGPFDTREEAEQYLAEQQADQITESLNGRR
jgi:hypothetical protein